MPQETIKHDSPLPRLQADSYTVVLAWGQKKRHIVVNGKILCEPDFSNHIRQRGDCGYNSITVSGIPDYPKKGEDSKYTHTDGIIPFLPLDQISGLINTSICAQCSRKYEKYFLPQCEKCGKQSKTVQNTGTENFPYYECGTCRHRAARRTNTREMWGRGRKGY